MEIKRTIETTNAKYDITGLTQKEYRELSKAYLHYLHYICRCTPEDNALLNKINAMDESEIKIV